MSATLCPLTACSLLMAMAATASSSLTCTASSLLGPHAVLLRASGYAQELSRLQSGVQHDVYRPHMDRDDVIHMHTMSRMQAADCSNGKRKLQYQTPKHKQLELLLPTSRSEYSCYCTKAKADNKNVLRTFAHDTCCIKQQHPSMLLDHVPICHRFARIYARCIGMSIHESLSTQLGHSTSRGKMLAAVQL